MNVLLNRFQRRRSGSSINRLAEKENCVQVLIISIDYTRIELVVAKSECIVFGQLSKIAVDCVQSNYANLADLELLLGTSQSHKTTLEQ